ncbi:MAG: hypothetical protein KBH07_01480 [Flavobacteriales bacterium]|nr:hypothetical protein [Flavobacteriales bacterium]MBP9079021.1 hypothetical protein [Flavobacteriales bacterium]
MKTLARNSAFFIIAFIGVALGMDQVVQRWFIFNDPASNPSKIRRLVESEDPGEIPVFGSSKGRSAFIPDSLAPTVYNYSMERGNFDIVEFLLETELAKPRKTPVLLEFNHRYFIHAPSYTIDMATFAPNVGLPGVSEFLEKSGRLETRFMIPGLRYFGSIEGYVRKGMDEDGTTSRQSVKGGLFTERAVGREQMANQVAARERSIALRQKLEHAKNDVKEAISAEDRHRLVALNSLLLFNAPEERVARFEELVASRPDRQILMAYTPQHWSELKGIANFHEITALFAELQKRHPNLHFYDYSHMQLPDSAYKNSAHLNNTGARAFCEAFKRDAGQYLQAP